MENILNDKVEIKNESYYYQLYKLLIDVLKETNPRRGLEKTLEKTRELMDCDCIKLYKIENNNYDCVKTLLKEQYRYNDKFYDSEADLIFETYRKKENNKSKRIDIQLIGGKTNVSFMPVNCENGSKYIVYIINNKLKHDESYDEFMNNIAECFNIVLIRVEEYNKLKKLSYEDGLTKLKNRTYYNEKIKKIETNDGIMHVTYALIDLFRLKYVNDNINHSAGDTYIEKTAQILRKYFPKTNINGMPTGDTVFRIGGDEFSIISLNKSKEEVENILKFANQEVNNINIDTDLETVLAINYGVAETYDGANIENLYEIADKKLQMHKTKMYLDNNIDRRR